MKQDWAVAGINKRITELEEVKLMIDDRIGILRAACVVLGGTSILDNGQVDTGATPRRMITKPVVRRPANTSPDAPDGYLAGFRASDISGMTPSDALVKVARAGKGLLYPKAVGGLLVDSGIYPGVEPNKAGHKAYILAWGQKKKFRRIGSGVFKLVA